MRVKVRYFTTLRELAGSSEEELELENGSTLADLLKKIAEKYGKKAKNYLFNKGKIDPSIYFLINGISARSLKGLETTLEEGDVIAIIPPIGGGSMPEFL